MENKKPYDVIDFIDDVIHGLKYFIGMGLFMMAVLALWGIYYPNAETTFIAIVNELVRYFS